AAWLEDQADVSRVNYPGLPRNPGFERATQLFGANLGKANRQPRYGALLSFELRPEIDCLKFLNALEVVILSTHLGDNRTLALPAAHTIYYEMGPQKRAQMGIGDNLIRVSVGIEDTDDLI